MSFSYPPDKNKPLPRVSVDEIVTEKEEEDCVEIPGWRPWTLSTLVLMSAIVFTAGLVILIGLLQWQQFRNGALFATSTTGNFSNMQNFLYQYLPTIIIVLYGMGWSWIDLDIKRLEPWYQLADRRSAKADQSLLLHYPLDFLPFVPFKSAKRKQWSVVSASTIMVLVVWAVTPLQNGIFSNTQVTRSSGVSVKSSKALLPSNQQDSALGIHVLNRAYASLWLGQSLPPFTTGQYALSPFEIVDITQVDGSNQTLTAKTNLYGVDVSCNPPAKVSIDTTSVTFDDGKGCLAQDLISYATTEFSKQFISYFIGYYDDPHADSSLQLAGCPAASARTSLAIWKRASKNPPNFSDPNNATALFCTASYYMQPVNATVSIPDETVIGVVPVGGKTLITDDIFNITQFEYVLANGAPAGVALAGSHEVPQTRLDIVDNTILHQDTQVTNMSLEVPVPNMIAFAIGTTKLSPESYLEPTTLANSLEQAWSLTFAIAVSSMIDKNSTKIPSEGTSQASFEAVVLVPVFSILSQGFLLAIVAFTCILLYLTQRRPSKLAQDPDSLCQIMRLAQDARLRRMFNQLDCANDKQLVEALKQFDFNLSCDKNETYPIIHYSTPESDSTFNRNPTVTFDRQKTTSDRYIRPLEYSLASRFGIIVTLAGLTFGLIYIRNRAIQENGLALPSENTIVQQILINFIPTSIATLLEPFFVLVCRLACLLRPLEELKAGNAPAKTTLLSRYTSVPPQLVIWRALKDRRFLLAGLCLLSLLANVLTVALSGLLNIYEVPQATPAALQPLYQASFPVNSSSNFTGLEAAVLNQYNLNNAFYVADSNLSDSVSLPAWTTETRFFLPMDLTLSNPQIQTGYEWIMKSRGYAAELDCEELSPTPSTASYDLEFGLNASFVKLVATYTDKDGAKLQCKLANGLSNATGGDGSSSEDTVYAPIFGDPSGRKGFELSTAMASVNALETNDTVDPCATLFVRGWVRVEQGAVSQAVPVDQNSGNLPQPLGTKATFVSCRTNIKSAMFDIRTSSSGRILSQTQVSADTLEPSSSSLKLSTDTMLSDLSSSVPPIWHNDTISTDWFNYLLKQQTRSTDFMNASLPPPTYQAAANQTSELLGRLFAIQMSLLSSQLAPATVGSAAQPVTMVTTERRIFVSESLFWISLGVLCLDLLIMVVFYWRVPKAFLPRIPNSIASQIAFFAGSHVIDDVQKAGGDLRELDAQGYRYGYGKYIGQDGWAHVGIERVPYVTKLRDETSSFANLFRRRKRKG